MPYEDRLSDIQDLTFNSFDDEVERRGLALDSSEMKEFKFCGREDLYNNLALLFSDQCQHKIYVSVFQEDDCSVFKKGQEFSGSVIKQLNDVYEFIDSRNEIRASFAGLHRTDTRDYPEIAVKEALLNCIIHRDYLSPGSTIINIYRDHMEFISLGGLAPGFSIEAAYLGASDSRNPKLASVFLRLGLVEGYGTGVRKIIDSYKAVSCPPKFQAVVGAFKVTLYNENEKEIDYYSGDLISEPRPQYNVNIVPRDVLADSILKLAREKGVITRKDVQDKFNVGSTKAFLCLKILCENGKLKQQKMGKQTSYTLN
ncbi:MAG: hypothetical protein ILP16_04670 [Spirochaetales bacterium]|nr:hypothetical protein [Spirochaetales bacterium]